MTLIADANVVMAALAGAADPHGAAVEQLVRDVEARGERLVVTEGVLAETAWVLRVRFGMTQLQISGALLALLDSAAFDSWDPPLVTDALRIMADEPRLDLVDALLAARDAAGTGQVVTLDRVLARTIAREHGRA
jgi:predicted nucleic acid-binding protein